MFSRGGVTPHTYFTRWWMQYDNGTIVYNVGVKIPRPSFDNTRGVLTTFPVTTLPSRAVTLSAHNRSGNRPVLHSMSPSFQAAPPTLLLPISFSHFSRGPESRHSLCRQASLLSVLWLPFGETGALLSREPAWHLLNRATPSDADSTIWRDGRQRSTVSWTQLPFSA